MNHGGMAFLAFNKIKLSEDLLLPLSVTEGSPLDGLFYPTPSGPAYEHVEARPDLMLTPIPYRAWPRSAGLRLELKHKAGMLSDMALYLKENNIDIITDQCTRAGHRYATWNLVVEFEDFRGVPAEELAKAMPVRVEELKTQILRECREILQEESSSNSPELRTPVGAWALRGLNHFYRHSKEHPERKFSARCRAGNAIDIEGPESIEGWFELKREFPAVGFASLDTEGFMIRVAVLKKSELERFRSVSVGYSLRRRGHPELTSRGALCAITQALKPHWNIWRLHGERLEDSNEIENYVIRLVMESRGASKDDGEIRKSLQSALVNSAIPKLMPDEPIVSSISPHRIFVSLRNHIAFPKRGTVIRLCRLAAEEIGILGDNLVFVHDHTSGSTTEKVAREIENCHGMLQFYMGSPEEPAMDWLNAEFFLASYLELPRLRVIDENLTSSITFERDRSHLCFSREASDSEIQAVIREALQELDQEMRSWNWALTRAKRSRF